MSYEHLSLFQMLIKTLEGLKKLVAIAKEFVQKSKAMFDQVVEASEKLKGLAEAGKKAMADVAKYTREKIINIHEMCFETGLKGKTGACFKFKISATFLGSKKIDIDTEGCLDKEFAMKIGKELAKQLYPGIDKIKEGLMKVKEKFTSAEKQEADLKKLEENAEKLEDENAKLKVPARRDAVVSRFEV